MDLLVHLSLTISLRAADSPIKPFKAVLREADTRPRYPLHSPSHLAALLPVANKADEGAHAALRDFRRQPVIR